jgi:multidrug efflux pump subunit AcrA (membrane-fusion protein)
MKRVKATDHSESSQKMRPALTPEADENQLISLATNLARKQLMNGTASSQVITHYLKLGSTTAQLEKETLKKQNELLTAKTEALQSQKRIEDLYANALAAMKRYSGNGSVNDED